MKRTLLIVAAVLLGIAGTNAQVRVAAKYNYPLLPGSEQDSVLNGLKSIRAVAFDNDVDGDGKSEIAATTYSGGGRVCIFEVVGNDSIRLVWMSPRGTATTGDSPRSVAFGDLDNDGRKEVIFHVSGSGFMIFEWDGVVGSDNYGTSPSQVIGLPFVTATTVRYLEHFEILDIDGDGLNELVTAYDARTTNADDQYYVLRASGDWSTNDPGFSSFEVEHSMGRTDPGASAYGLGGSPVAMITANLDGTGNREILVHNWNRKNVVPLTVPSPNTYVWPDTAAGRQQYYLSGVEDNVALMGAIAYDIDGDGRDEVYFPTYNNDQTNRPQGGIIHMVSYNAGQSTAGIDSTNVTALSLSDVSGAKDVFGYGWGDMNNNGKKELYFTTSYSTNVVALEFQGGDKRIPASWATRLVYAGDSTIYNSVTYRDSAGVRDTLRSVNTAFASKIWGRNTDFDRDGFEDIILPYQALNDSTTFYNLTWNGGTSQYDTVRTTAANPKRWGLRVIERDASNSVGAKDITIITPEDYRLDQNYPNPFNPTTTISFYLPIRDKISLKVYDVLGREVRTLITNQDYEAGTSRIVWDGKDNAGRYASTGTYFYTLRFGNFEKTNKMMLIK